jgi:hypothetical protein
VFEAGRGYGPTEWQCSSEGVHFRGQA